MIWASSSRRLLRKNRTVNSSTEARAAYCAILCRRLMSVRKKEKQNQGCERGADETRAACNERTGDHGRDGVLVQHAGVERVNVERRREQAVHHDVCADGRNTAGSGRELGWVQHTRSR